jgi:signal transduction histidine kinase
MSQRVKQDYKELKSFTDNASHEMMTPLAVINSKLDTLLQTAGFSDQQGELIEDIYLAIGR